MKKIPLTQGKFAIVDDCDYEWLMQWKWCYDSGYAERRYRGKKVYMHKIITESAGGLVTRKTRNLKDKLDYRRFNLDLPSIILPTLPEGIKGILLTQGKYTVIDACDYNYLNQWSWQYHKGYATRVSETGEEISMSRVILERMGHTDFQRADHKNRDTLNNRRCNLRLATASQNRANSVKQNNRTASKYKGVTWHQRAWWARITKQGKQIHLGRFDDEIEAARAYDNAAKKYFGEFARLNGV